MSWSTLFNNAESHSVQRAGEARFKESQKEEKKIIRQEQEKNKRLGISLPATVSNHRKRDILLDLPPLPPLKRHHPVKGDKEEGIQSIASADENAVCKSQLSIKRGGCTQVDHPQAIVANRSVPQKHLRSTHRQRPIRSTSFRRANNVIPTSKTSTTVDEPVMDQVRMQHEVVPPSSTRVEYRCDSDEEYHRMRSVAQPADAVSSSLSQLASVSMATSKSLFESINPSQSQQSSQLRLRESQLLPKAAVQMISDSESESDQIQPPSSRLERLIPAGIETTGKRVTKLKIPDSFVASNRLIHKSTPDTKPLTTSSLSASRSRRQSELLDAAHDLDTDSMRLNPVPQACSMNDMLLGLVHAKVMTLSQAFHPADHVWARSQLNQWEKQRLEKPFGSPVQYPHKKAEDRLSCPSKSQLLEQQRYSAAGYQQEMSEYEGSSTDERVQCEEDEQILAMDSDLSSEYRESQ